MDKKILVTIFTVLLLFSVSSQVYADESNEQIDVSKFYELESSDYTGFAEVKQTDKIIFEIGMPGCTSTTAMQ